MATLDFTLNPSVFRGGQGSFLLLEWAGGGGSGLISHMQVARPKSHHVPNSNTRVKIAIYIYFQPLAANLNSSGCENLARMIYGQIDPRINQSTYYYMEKL